MGDKWQILEGDVRAVAPRLPVQAFHALITSPPYLHHRAFPGATTIWPAPHFPLCENGAHAWGERVTNRVRGQEAGDRANVGNTKSRVDPTTRDHGRFCTRCYAWEGQLGCEYSEQDYCLHLFQAIDACAFALRPDASIWLVVGDTMHPEMGMMDIPSLVAQTFWNYGWRVQSEIIWYARNKSPESVMGWHYQPHRVLDRAKRKYLPCPGCTECFPHGGYVLRKWRGRPTRAHETVLMLTKGNHYYDTAERPVDGGKAATTVWDIPTVPDRAKTHTAPFPKTLVQRILSLATSPHNCPVCGAPYARRWRENRAEGTKWQPMLVPTDTFEATCACVRETWPIGPLVLDPFSGKGTTGEATLEAGGRYVGVEIDPAAAAASRTALAAVAP